jgi:hypothetical protein
MRRLAIALLTSLGLTLVISGPAGAAKPAPLPELAFVGDPQAAIAVPDSVFPGMCLVPLDWDAAPAAPKGTSFREYQVAVASIPNPAWESYGANVFTDSQGNVRVPNGTTSYLNVRAMYVKDKGKHSEIFTPYGDGTGPYTWTC